MEIVIEKLSEEEIKIVKALNAYYEAKNSFLDIACLIVKYHRGLFLEQSEKVLVQKIIELAEKQ